jgi:hypothetical protein
MLLAFGFFISESLHVLSGLPGQVVQPSCSSKRSELGTQCTECAVVRVAFEPPYRRNGRGTRYAADAKDAEGSNQIHLLTPKHEVGEHGNSRLGVDIGDRPEAVFGEGMTGDVPALFRCNQLDLAHSYEGHIRTSIQRRGIEDRSLLDESRRTGSKSRWLGCSGDMLAPRLAERSFGDVGHDSSVFVGRIVR